MLYVPASSKWPKWLQSGLFLKRSSLTLLSKDEGTTEARSYALDEMPQYLRFNEWILGGYRAPHLSTLECIQSIFCLHNESANILTHGLPILYVIYNYAELFADNWVPNSYLTYCHMVSCISPWLGSFLYHVFMNHKCGKDMYVRLLQADMAGIWITQTFGALTTLNTSFLDLGDLTRQIIVGLYLCLAFKALHLGLTAQSARQRAASFSLLVLVRAIALVVRLCTGRLAHFGHLVHVLMQEVAPIIGVIVSVLRLPERLSPGSFDLVLNSHNLMHCLVLLGGYHMHCAFLVDIRILFGNLPLEGRLLA